MHDAQDDVKSRFKLAQLLQFLKYGSRCNTRDVSVCKAVVDNILKDDFDVNCRFTIKPGFFHMPMENCMALHCVYSACGIVAFDSLLERGADFTAKNDKGNTVLHSAISSRGIEQSPKRALRILSAHVKHQNAVNPQNNNGISHLHGACIVDHVASLKLFLDNGASVNQAVNDNSENYPGFTPLHFTALYDSLEAAQVLVSCGANVNAKNAKGMTPLDECLNHRLKLLPILRRMKNDKARQTYQNKVYNNEKIVKLLLNSQCISSVGLSEFHVASTLSDLSIADNLLNRVIDIDHAVPIESPICSGYTAAHFAALNSVDAVKMLVMRGAKLDIKDAAGLTPFDICVKNYSMEDVHDILASAENCKSIRLPGGKTPLLAFLKATASLDQFKLLLQHITEDVIVPSDSSLWQGNTILHLAVIISKGKEDIGMHLKVEYEKSLVEECLRVGQSFNVQNARGESAIHLAFKLGKTNILKLLFEQLNNQGKVANLVDRDNLSYLHIACAENNVSLVEKLLGGTSVPNIIYTGKVSSGKISILAGSTPLHVAVTVRAFAIAEMLLHHGADLHATDSNGITPIHTLMRRLSYFRNDWQLADLLLRALLNDPKECANNVIGLSYLHVACFFGNVQAVQKLLELGSDVNALFSLDNQFFSKDWPMFPRLYTAFTPLHMAQDNSVAEVKNLLILHGADVFAKASKEYIDHVGAKFPLQHKNVIRPFMTLLWDREEMQKQMEEKLGLTRLHIACYMKNEEYVRSVLNSGVVDVNAQIHADSEIFAGGTPLHLLLKISRKGFHIMVNFEENVQHNLERFAVNPIIQLLLDHGADVTITDVEKNTPIHLLCKYQHYFTDSNRCEDLLMNAHRDFGVNPANDEGMSHLHLACYLHKVDVVKKFLQHGSVDVNRPIDFFASANPGSTPLHLALTLRRDPDWPRVSQVVDLLLKYGADVAAKDVFGDTPLHKRAPMQSPGWSILNKLVSHGADINSENVEGQIPFDKNSFSDNGNANDFVNIFKKYNYRINSWNRMTGEGHIAKILLSSRANVTNRPEFKELLQSSYVKEVDEMGRTVIHNSVAIVHRPVFGNNQNVNSAIEKFVALGLDLDYQDKSGQAALHYAARKANVMGTKALLKCGANVNIVDNSGMSAFSYAVEHEDLRIFEATLGTCEITAITLYMHVETLLLLRIEVSGLNKNLSNSIRQILDRMKMNSVVRRRFDSKFGTKESFFNQLEMTKSVDIGVASLVLFDFLNDTGGVTQYPFLSVSGRTVVDDFFRKKLNENEFEELSGILKLQYHKMKARLELIDPALAALRTLLGFSFPGLCEQITRFLLNSDLKKTIASVTMELS